MSCSSRRRRRSRRTDDHDHEEDGYDTSDGVEDDHGLESEERRVSGQARGEEFEGERLTRLVPGFEPPEEVVLPVLVEEAVGRRIGTVAVALKAVRMATR